MTQIRFLLIGAFTIILAISCQQVNALKCWKCITLFKEACGEPFEPSKLHKLDYGECPWKCATLVFNNSDGVKSWSRFCAKDQAELDQRCKMQDKISCESCDTDGCNGKNRNTAGPIVLFIVIPMLVAKKFLF